MIKLSALPLVALAASLSAPVAAQVSMAETGSLTADDDTTAMGMFADQYIIEGVEGETLEVAVSSDDFDSYLIVRGPNGERFENDDAVDGSLDARILRRLPTTGAYTIEVSSYWEGETGAYGLNAATRPPVPSQVVIDTTGELTAQSQQLPDGKYVAIHEVTVQAGQQVTVELTSDSFDTFAVLLSSSGQPLVEDDDGGEGTNSRIEAMIETDGTYLVGVTSYAPGTTGTYSLTVTLD